MKLPRVILPSRLRLQQLRSRLRWPRSRWPAAGLAFVILLLLWWWSGSGSVAPSRWSHDAVLDAIRFVESSHRDDVPDGDGGKAIGPFQIHFLYWQDALQAEPSLGGSYQDCRRRAYAERVVAAYMQRWVPDAWATGDAEVIARVHNGGPKGAEIAATLGYWERVRVRLP